MVTLIDAWEARLLVSKPASHNYPMGVRPAPVVKEDRQELFAVAVYGAYWAAYLQRERAVLFCHLCHLVFICKHSEPIATAIRSSRGGRGGSTACRSHSKEEHNFPSLHWPKKTFDCRRVECALSGCHHTNCPSFRDSSSIQRSGTYQGPAAPTTLIEMVFLVDRSRIMQKGGFVEWIFKLLSRSTDGVGPCASTSEQLPDYLSRLLLRVADGLFLRWSGDDGTCWSDDVDWNLKEKLEDDDAINWCAQTSVLYPVKFGESVSTSVKVDETRSVVKDSADLSASIEFLHHVISALEENERSSNSFHAKELSILVLANLIGKAILLYCGSDSLVDLTGIYLPNSVAGQPCRKYPLVLTQNGDRFVPLLHPKRELRISESVTSVTVPLVTRDLKFLRIKSLERERLQDYDILLNFLEISVKRDKERANYFFIAAYDEGSVYGNCTDAETPAIITKNNLDDNSLKSVVEENSKQTREQEALNIIKLETNLVQRKVNPISYPKIVETNLPMVHFVPNLVPVSKSARNNYETLSRHSITTKIVNPKVLATGTREVRNIFGNETNVKPNPGFQITEIDVENSPNVVGQFQSCLALGCNNLVTDKKTFPLCRTCSTTQIHQNETKVNIRRNLTDTSAIQQPLHSQHGRMSRCCACCSVVASSTFELNNFAVDFTENFGLLNGHRILRRSNLSQ